MSETYDTESEDEDGDLPEAAAPVRNCMTPRGYSALQEELRRLTREERPRVVEIVSWAAGNGDRSENGDYIYGRKRLREIDRRLRYLTRRIASAELVDPAAQQGLEQVFFGATVTFLRQGREQTVTLVGVDEADLRQGRISWISPLARALMKSRAGDIVELRAPGGGESIEVLAVRYGSPGTDSG